MYRYLPDMCVVLVRTRELLFSRRAFFAVANGKQSSSADVQLPAWDQGRNQQVSAAFSSVTRSPEDSPVHVSSLREPIARKRNDRRAENLCRIGRIRDRSSRVCSTVATADGER